MLGKNLSIAAAGGGANPVYVDDVFKAQLYRGSSTADTVINQGGDGVDLTGGGLVWIKCRDNTHTHQWYDSARGLDNGYITSETAARNVVDANGVTSLNSDGFTVGNSTLVNQNGKNYVGWCFKKSKGFFDVVTWDGNSTAGRTISHNLGSVPGMIIVKAYENTSTWMVYHKDLDITNNEYLELDTEANAAQFASSNLWNGTAATSTEFTVGDHLTVNSTGRKYVAYIFADNDQSFGADEDEAVIKCGHYYGNGGSEKFIDLGFEPQFLLVKKVTGTYSGDWLVVDDMRGFGSASLTNIFQFASKNSLDGTGSTLVWPDSSYSTANNKGFRLRNSSYQVNANNSKYIYMAIRQKNKPVETAAEVFTPDAYGLNEAAHRIHFEADHRVDLVIQRHRTSTVFPDFYDRYRGSGRRINSQATSETATTQQVSGHLDFHTGTGAGTSAGNMTGVGANMFRRAPGFFDIVRYKGLGSNNRVVKHNLGVTPEWIWVKNMTVGRAWVCWHSGLDGIHYYHLMQGTTGQTASSAYFGGSNAVVPNANDFTVGSNTQVNETSQEFVAYLWATLPGISKVGTYDGSASDVDVDCGFTGSARLVMIKRKTPTTGNNWWVFDSARGIVAGNDPVYKINSNVAEANTTDYIDAIAGGFRINSANAPADLNSSGSTYLFMAIA